MHCYHCYLLRLIKNTVWDCNGKLIFSSMLSVDTLGNWRQIVGHNFQAVFLSTTFYISFKVLHITTNLIIIMTLKGGNLSSALLILISTLAPVTANLNVAEISCADDYAIKLQSVSFACDDQCQFELQVPFHHHVSKNIFFHN